jgi:hypothetical protein
MGMRPSVRFVYVRIIGGCPFLTATLRGTGKEITPAPAASTAFPAHRLGLTVPGSVEARER